MNWRDNVDPISKIAFLLEEIREKHGSASTFTVKNYGANIAYQTYIAKDVAPAHVDHPDLHSAMLRLQGFVDVDDLLAHNSEIAKQMLYRLKEEQVHIDEQIEECKRHL